MRACVRVLWLPVVMALTACGKAGQPEASADAEAQPAAAGLTAEQLEKGIGPVTAVALADDVDDELAEAGAAIFKVKCSACHKIGERYIGPDLTGVTERRKPEYVMNMILNPTEMVQKHPTAKDLLAQFNYTQMADQQLTEAEARKVLEYLREVTEESKEKQTGNG